MPAKTIDEVIQQLDDIIDRTYRQKSRLGYFAALYRKVTLRVTDLVKVRKDFQANQMLKYKASQNLQNYW